MDYHFQELTPISDVKLKAYKDALDYVFENESIKNIGITGAYGAGKSSLIETYKKDRKDINFIHISLAYFKIYNSEEEEAKNDSKANVLEGKILNQLIHQIDPNKIPLTNFSVKKRLSSQKVLLHSLMAVLFLIICIFIVFYKQWVLYVNFLNSNTWIQSAHRYGILGFFFKEISNPILIMPAGIIGIGIMAYGVYSFINIQSNKNIFKKFNVQGNEIEIFEEEKDSYFDKYLNEVLYLFDNSDADAIVFEDMDRYNANQIFQRLREINTLVNNYRSKRNKKPIRFLYLLRDDIFISKDRTKFFDFIIPVVPVIDGSNSYDQFINHFKKAGIYSLFQENFLQEVSLYVDDMRILKNIYNEFVIYNNMINTTEQDPNKLLAIIIYKNLFPKDFSDLQLNKGFVYTLFAKKEEFVKDEIKVIEEQIESIEKIIKAADKEHLVTEGELDYLYRDRLQTTQNRYGYNSKEVIILRDEINLRKEAIKCKKKNELEDYKIKLSNLQDKQKQTQFKKLSEIIHKENKDQIFNGNEIGTKHKFDDVTGSDYFDLITYLIRNGYIDETYPDYMTYFYENSLNKIDKVFLRSITDERAKEYTYALKNPEKILSRLKITDFSHEEILNFDLLDYLLSHKDEYNEDRVVRIIKQVEYVKKFNFIEQFFDTKRSESAFVLHLNKLWPSFFAEVLTDSKFLDINKKEYALSSLYYSSNEDLEIVDEDNELSTFISKRADFLQVEYPNIERLIETFKLLQIEFKDIEYDISNKELFLAVYRNNLYELNFNLICLILNKIYAYMDIEEMRHKNYTLILSKPSEPIVEYIHDNINQYLQIVFNNCESIISDSEEVITQILNSTDIEEDNKQKYLTYLQTKLTDLKYIIDTTWWPILLNENHIVYSEQNIIEYFFHSGNEFDDVLVKFINQFAISYNYDYNEIDNAMGEESARKFLDAVIRCNTLTNENYKMILKSLHMQYILFNEADIDLDKYKILIDLNYIIMNKENLEFIRTAYSGKSTVSFIERNITKYVDEVISAENFDKDEMMEILESKVDDKYKIALLSFTKEPISIIGQDYSDTVKSYILKNNLAIDEIPLLLKEYVTESKEMRLALEQLSITHFDEILQDINNISMDLYYKLIALQEVKIDKRIELFSLFASELNKQQCQESIDIIGMSEYNGIFEGGRPKIKVTENSKGLLELFKSKNWISSYDYDKDDNNYYRAIGKKRSREEELPERLL